VSFNWNPNLTELVITAVLSLVGWAVKRALTRIDQQAAKIAEIELTLARDYVKHDHLSDLHREQRRIGRMLGYIQLQLVALAARLNVRVEPFGGETEEETHAIV
jgi:DNA primase